MVGNKANVKYGSLLPRAVEKGIAYVPGAPFFAGKPMQNTLRLNFTHATEEQIQVGMELLTSMFREVNKESVLLK